MFLISIAVINVKPGHMLSGDQDNHHKDHCTVNINTQLSHNSPKNENPVIIYSTSSRSKSPNFFLLLNTKDDICSDWFLKIFFSPYLPLNL